MFARRFVRSLIVLVPVAVLTASCTSHANVQETVEVTETVGGWYDAGIVDGKNKIVPTLSFRLRKKGDADIAGVSINVAFRHPAAPGATTEDEWDEVFLPNVRFTEGAQTAPLVVRTEKGYTGDPPQSRLDLMKNSQFRDVRARVFAKSGGGQWVELAAVDVPRHLITR